MKQETSPERKTRLRLLVHALLARLLARRGFWAALLVPVFLLVIYFSRAGIRSIYKRVEICAGEVGAAFETVFTISPLGNELLFGCGLNGGNELHRIHLETYQGRKVEILGSVMRLYNASPGQRFLPFKILSHYDIPKNGANGSPLEQMMIYDQKAERAVSVMPSGMTIGRYPVWLNEQLFMFSGRANGAGSGFESFYLAEVGKSGEPKLVRETYLFAARQITYFQQNLVYLTNFTVAMEEAGEIVILDLETTTLQVISRFDGEFSSLSWLNFSKENGCFLFCSYRRGENYRNLFRFDPPTKKTTRLTTAHTYNGQWLQGGSGYAFIGNSNNNFYLGIRAAGGAGETNLFLGGQVERYSVSADGQRIYAVASTNAEPRALWEYQLKSMTNRMLIRGNKKEFRETVVSVPTQATVVSFDGLRIPTYLFPPKDCQAGRQYPLAIYLPPRTAQCSRGYELQAQMLANLGFYYLGVNYRGCDGYGRDYAARWDAPMAAQDVRAVIQEALKDPRFDKTRIFMVGLSESCLVLSHYLALDPKTLKAIVFESPGSFDVGSPLAADRLPSLLVSVGDHDPALESVRAFAQWARDNSAAAQFYYIKDFGHPGSTEIRARVEQEKRTAKFLLEHL